MKPPPPPPGPPWDLPVGEAPFAFVDLEMTGLDVERDRIVEICIERWVGGAKRDGVASLVRPDVRMGGAAHVHGLDALDRGGVRYVLSGGGGSPLYPGPVKRRLHHWLEVEVGPDGIVETVHPLRGAPFPLTR